MLAYIERAYSLNTVYCYQVVTEQDYHECGPFSNSFRAYADTEKEARAQCVQWCKRNNVVITTADKVAGD